MSLEDTNKPWLDAWPTEDLETVVRCPACEGIGRTTMHDDLIDHVFRVAPGKWTLWECTDCGTGYLSPRPTEASISRAYEAYYTHKNGAPRAAPQQLSPLRLLRRACANGYLNSRYGTRYQPASSLGRVLASVFPTQREILDAQFRWLPRPTAGQTLLDIGCGNGEFLLTAREAGWLVCGLDPDRKAVARAQDKGIRVQEGSIHRLVSDPSSFDAITISHVLEHVHDPSGLLNEAFRLLKPGGILYIDTPNVRSNGHQLFGKNWRGLEAPRHLSIFSIEGLLQLLGRSGFVGPELKQRRSVASSIFLDSFNLATQDGCSASRMPLRHLLRSRFPLTPKSQSEFITLVAYKPE